MGAKKNTKLVDVGETYIKRGEQRMIGLQKLMLITSDILKTGKHITCSIFSVYIYIVLKSTFCICIVIFLQASS